MTDSYWSGRVRERGGGEEPVEAEGRVPGDDPKPVELPAREGIVVGAAVQAAACGLEGDREEAGAVMVAEMPSDGRERRKGQLPVPGWFVGVGKDGGHGVG